MSLLIFRSEVQHKADRKAAQQAIESSTKRRAKEVLLPRHAVVEYEADLGKKG